MALIDIVCECGHTHEVNRPVAEWPHTPLCPDCGAPTVQIHLPRRTYHEFAAYYDHGLGAYLTTRDQRRQLLRAAHAEGKDGMRPGDLSARKDRVMADRQARAREAPTTRKTFS